VLHINVYIDYAAWVTGQVKVICEQILELTHVKVSVKVTKVFKQVITIVPILWYITI
jgi:hypothetical protein